MYALAIFAKKMDERRSEEISFMKFVISVLFVLPGGKFLTQW